MTRSSDTLPDALANVRSILDRLAARRLALFLDYDGTLAPIAPTPGEAVLPSSTRAVLHRLTTRCTVAVISGRDRSDVEGMVGIPGLVYAGAHGFDIAGGALGTRAHSMGAEFAPALQRVRARLQESLGTAAGVLLEFKRASIAIHYRLAPATAAATIEKTTRQAMEGEPELRLMAGKKVLEIQPAIDWHKGRALLWLIEALHLDGDGSLAVYIGDDVTDEDAFRAIEHNGIGIRVDGAEGTAVQTAATFALPDTAGVERFLSTLADALP